MNTHLRLVLLAALVIAAGACGGDSSQPASPSPTALPALPHSMKGYELYSWQADGRWRFALMTGTDRLKSVAEIVAGPDTEGEWVRLGAESTDALNGYLRRLPPNESIHWIGKQTREQVLAPAGPLDLPPPAIVAFISAYCASLRLNLHVSP